MKTQLQRLEKLLLKGCTSMEIIKGTGSTTPSKRRHDLKQRGWKIDKVKVPGTNYHMFFGKAPKCKS